MLETTNKISLPKRITFYINFKCNLKCPYCYLPEIFFEKKESPIKEICRKIRNFGIEEIDILGGEPFYFKERFLYFLKFCLANKIELRSISTNGTIVDEGVFKLLKKFKNCIIQISLDAATPNTYKIVRGVPLFPLVIKNIRIFAKWKFNVILSFVINKKNYKEMDKFINLAKKLKIKGISVGGFIPLGRGKLIKNWQLPCVKLIEIYLLLKKEKNINIFGTKETACDAGKETIALLANGELYPCGLFISFPETKLGNILTSKEKFFDNSFFSKIIDKINPFDQCKKCPLPSVCPNACKAFIYSNLKRSFNFC